MIRDELPIATAIATRLTKQHTNRKGTTTMPDDEFFVQGADLLNDEVTAYLEALSVFGTIARAADPIPSLNDALIIVLAVTGAHAMITDNPDGTTDVECFDHKAWAAALVYSDILTGVI